MNIRLLSVVLASSLLLGGSWKLWQGSYIHLKAHMAQLLLKTAWAKTLAGGREVRPWPWADTWPIARLTVPRLGIRRFVLAGASGAVLAFGPGHLFATPLPGKGNSVIAGHRDTSFHFLSRLRLGDRLTIQLPDGTRLRFRVNRLGVVAEDDPAPLQPSRQPRLTLVTCYPFNALLPGGPLRYVVVAGRIPQMQPAEDARLRQAGIHPQTERKLVANSPHNWNKIYVDD